MDYELAKKLKDTGFPQTNWDNICCQHRYSRYPKTIDEEIAHRLNSDECEVVVFPTLSELIEACGDGFEWLGQTNRGHFCAKGTIKDKTELFMHEHIGYDTPEEAVANLWLALNKNLEYDLSRISPEAARGG